MIAFEGKFFAGMTQSKEINAPITSLYSTSTVDPPPPL